MASAQIGTYIAHEEPMDLNISDSDLRSLVISILRESPTGQFNSVYRAVASLAREKGFAKSEPAHRGYGVHMINMGGEMLNHQDQARVSTILNDLVDERVIRAGLNDGLNNNFPFFHVTANGKRFLADDQPSASDPDGYFARLKGDIPALDGVIETYLRESLLTFKAKCLLSSAITIGCASEKALLLLIDAYATALPQSAQEKFRKDTDGKMIKRQFEEFNKRLESHLKPRLPGDLKDDLDVTLSGVFTLIRKLRNEVGHPTGKSVTEEDAFANLRLFPMYLKKIYALMDWLSTNTL